MAGIALRKNGFEVRTVAAKAEAVATWWSEHFDVLLGGVELSYGSGLDLMRELAAICDIRGIAYTGYARESDVAASRAAGFLAHLTSRPAFRL